MIGPRSGRLLGMLNCREEIYAYYDFVDDELVSVGMFVWLKFAKIHSRIISYV
jgi:hypothetical protein